MSAENCPFCSIAKEGRLIYSDDTIVSFLSNPRQMPGHCLVIPKRHIEDPSQLSSKELQAIFTEIFRLERMLIKKGYGDGCDIRQHFRPFLPQGRIKIDHVHFHVLPRRLNDELYEAALQFETPLFVELPRNERAKLLAVLER